jgi:hypothetical protein
MNVTRLTLAAAFLLGAGCTALVDLDGLSGAADEPFDGGRDARTTRDAEVGRDAEPAAREAAVDASADAKPDPGPPAKTRVACDEPSACGDREACCIVYGNHADFCVKNDEDCTYRESVLIVQRCDDETDCAALGAPGTVCCGTIENGLYRSIACVAREQCKGVILCDAELQKCPEGKVCQKAPYSSDTWECE